MKREILVTAHRGASGLVKHENTIEAFEKAMEYPCFSIECDVRKTKDGIIIINHNPDIEGLLIKDYTYEELCAKTKENGYVQPTLEEALECVKGKMLIDIEIKEEGYEEELVNIILKHLTPEQFWIRSFYDDAIKKVKEVNNNITTVLLIGKSKLTKKERLSEIFPRKRIKYTKCDHISPYHKLLIWGFSWRMHLRKVKVLVWTLNNEEIMKKAIKKGADCLITNYPDMALELVNNLKK